MGKRGDLAFIFFILLLLAPTAYALDSQASINIGTIYETNSDDFILTIANIQGNAESIDDISAQTDGFTINTAEEPSGWQSIINAATMAWDIFLPNGFDWIANLPFINLGISSDAEQNFRFNAKALKVNNDTTYDWPVTSTFHDDTTDVEIVSITVLNDFTGPVLNDWTPQDGDYVKQWTTDLLASINATDPETGVAQVFFNYVDCADLNQSSKTSVNLTKNGDIFSDTTDVSAFPDSTDVCFSFIAENNGGAFSNESGVFIIDGIAPNITLVSPEDNARMNSQSDFEFIADDNLALTMECDLLVDGNVEVSVTALDEQVTVVPVANVSEGQHEWSVRCTDLAGWETTSETRTYLLDRTPPEIVMDAPASPMMRSGTLLEFTATDNFELDLVGYADLAGNNVTINKSTYTSINESHFTVDTAGYSEGYQQVWVDANDTAGNRNILRFDIIIDNTAPDVTLVSPVDNATTPAPFTFNATDYFDTMLDCTLYVDDADTGSTIVNTSQSPTSTILGDLFPGDYEWRVECEDDAGNTGSSDTWNITIIDVTGPQITINDIGTIIRGNIATLNLTIYDISGVDDASISVNVTDLLGITTPVNVVKQNGNYYGDYITTVNSEIGDYIVTVYAKDNPGNGNTATGSFAVTYSYVVSVGASPNPAESGNNVDVSGNVIMDNGSLVPEEFVTLMLPDTDILVPLDNATGDFSHAVSYSAGTYDITATITPSNGLEFNDTVTLQVNDPSGEGNNGNGEGNDNPDHNPDFKCGVNKYYDKDLKKCVKLPDKEPKKVSLPEQAKGDENSGSSGVLFAECGDNVCDQNENCNKCPEDCGVCESAPRVGKASGFLSLDKINSNLFWLVLLMLLSIMFILIYIRKKEVPGMKRDDFGLDDYLNRNK